MSTPLTPPVRIHPLWRVAQAVAVAVAVGVVGLLVLSPDLGLYVTWYVLVPAVPALLLVAPRVWRNLCPIAVVHQLPRVLGRGGARRLPIAAHPWTPALAAAGLFLIVPARHFLFNESGLALALFVLAVLAVAVVAGLLFAGKSGWCSTICPVAPVERLYGQQPMVEASHAHCAECVGCTLPCFDREGRAAVIGLVGEGGEWESGGNGRGWKPLHRTPTGVFAAAFPGFVLGYFSAPVAAGVAAVYLHVALVAAVSLVLLVLVQSLLRFPSRAGMRVAAAAAAGIYYWFTVPAVLEATAATFGLDPAPGWMGVLGTAALLGLVAVWLADSPRRSRAGGTPSVASKAAHGPI